jgi:hypothetical protein
MSIADIGFKLTNAGRTLSVIGGVIHLEITHIQTGSGNRAITGAETSLLTPKEYAPITHDYSIGPGQHRIASAIVASGLTYNISEIGLWNGVPGAGGSTLLMYWSQVSGFLTVKSATVDFLFENDLYFNQSEVAITVVADTEFTALAMIANHEAQSNPHVNYVHKVVDFVSQSEAEGGTNTSARAWSAQRVKQAFSAFLPFVPVQQGGGHSQSNNKIYIGWNVSGQLFLQVDSNIFDNLWPISVSGNSYTSSKAYTVAQNGSGLPMVFNWVGVAGQPAQVWGGNDGINHYVYNPSNFHVWKADYADASEDVFHLGGAAVQRSSGPSYVFQDTDGMSANAHVNGGTFYILRGNDVDSLIWEVNPTSGKWPFELNIDLGNATFGGWGNFSQQVTVGTGNGTGNGNATVYFKDANHSLTCDGSQNFVMSSVGGNGLWVNGKKMATEEYSKGTAGSVSGTNASGFPFVGSWKRFPGGYTIQSLTVSGLDNTSNGAYYSASWPIAFDSIISASMSDTSGHASGASDTEGSYITSYNTSSCSFSTQWNKFDVKNEVTIWAIGFSGGSD